MSGIEELDDGSPDVVGLLYSDKKLYEYPTYPSDNQDAYGIGI